MAWQELWALFRADSGDSPTATIQRQIAKLDELLTTMEDVEVAKEEKPSQALIRVEWQAAGFSCLPLVEAERRVRRSHREQCKELRGRLEDALGGLAKRARTASVPEILEARQSLLAIRRELESFVTGLRHEVKRSRISRGLLVLAPALVGGLCAFYLRTERGLRLERVEGLLPAAAYLPLSPDDSALALREDYLQAFMTEFSKSYFGHPSDFDSLYYDVDDSGKPTDVRGKPIRRRSLQHKLSLRNASHGEAMYLSSIDAVVDVIGPSEFPWSRLTVTPQVTVAFDPEKPRSLRLASHGVGPALDVVETLTAASGVVLSRLQLPIFHDDEIEPFTSLDVDSAPVDPTTGELAEPRYLRLSARPDAPGPQYFEVTAPRPGARDAASTCEPNTNPTAFGFYEEVRTMARLRQLTRTAYAEPVQLEVRYSSLDGKTSSESLRGKLGDSDIFYVPLSGLHSKDPRCKAPSILVGDEDHYGIPRAEDVAKLFVADDKLAHPKGSDLIVAQLGVDLLTAEPGRRIAADHPLDGFLDPRTDRDVHHERRPAPLREALVRRIPAIGRSERSALGAV